MIIYRLIEPEGPEKPGLPVGTIITVRAKSYDVVTRNDIGGTIAVPEGLYCVRIVREWYDYETGQHYAAMLTDQADLNRICSVTKTEYGPKAKDVDPSMVFFCEEAITK